MPLMRYWPCSTTKWYRSDALGGPHTSMHNRHGIITAMSRITTRPFLSTLCTPTSRQGLCCGSRARMCEHLRSTAACAMAAAPVAWA